MCNGSSPLALGIAILVACGGTSATSTSPAATVALASTNGGATAVGTNARATTSAASAAPGAITVTGGRVPNLVDKLMTLKTVRLALVPTEDATNALDANQAVLAYLKQALGADVTGVVAGSYNTKITAMGAKKVDVATFGAFEYLLAHEVANAQARIAARKADGTPTSYRSVIIAPAGSPIQTLANIRGRTIHRRALRNEPL